MADWMKTIEGRIRAATASGEFAKAGALWADLGDRLRREQRAGPLPAGAAREARELLNWCRTMAIVKRAHCQQRLNRLAIAGRYMPSRTRAPRRVTALL